MVIFLQEEERGGKGLYRVAFSLIACFFSLS